MKYEDNVCSGDYTCKQLYTCIKCLGEIDQVDSETAVMWIHT